MKDLDTVSYHSKSEEIVKILCTKTHNNNPAFYRVQVAYYMAKVAACLHTMLDTKTRGILPVNVYAINLAPSGFGKNHSTNIIEHDILSKFSKKFIEELMPAVAAKNIHNLAEELTLKAIDGDFEKELEKLQTAYDTTGEYYFSFSEGTSPAAKQIIQKINIAKIGSLNAEIDEIGNYITSSGELLTLYLETYDQGRVKPKLIKNTAENKRMKDIVGKVPTCLLMFGTPSKLLNGDREENEFYSLLETGYARRCLFGSAHRDSSILKMTPVEIYESQTNHENNLKIIELSEHFKSLADEKFYNKHITLTRNGALLNIEYQQYCEQRASKLKDHEELQQTELIHRYFKVLKLAGVYAFIDGNDSVSEDNMYAAIKLVEESGKAFENILKREKPYVKLAKFIANHEEEITQVEITEALSFYKGSSNNKSDLMNLAIAYGYKNHIMIQRSVVNNIEFFKGKTLKQTNTDELILSFSSDITSNYKNVTTSFDSLGGLLKTGNRHWINHHLIGELGQGHRHDDNIIKGFNLIVLDIDGTCKIEQAKALLENYSYYIHTTKSHTPQNHHFRIIIPINYNLELSLEDFKQFMSNIYDWFPFGVDTVTNQRSRKWATYDNPIGFKNQGQLLDALPFIPRTRKNEEYKNTIKELKDFNNLERWFAQSIENGNRNNTLIKYALLLADSGWGKEKVIEQITNFNSKISEPLSKDELKFTIFKTLETKYT